MQIVNDNSDVEMPSVRSNYSLFVSCISTALCKVKNGDSSNAIRISSQLDSIIWNKEHNFNMLVNYL